MFKSPSLAYAVLIVSLATGANTQTFMRSANFVGLSENQRLLDVNY